MYVATISKEDPKSPSLQLDGVKQAINQENELIA